uniref:Uncharacterized protein n=1 Tax=Arundo donax TaxID=35708 RepID=A0A0A8YFM4_ARUDO
MHLAQRLLTQLRACSDIEAEMLLFHYKKIREVIICRTTKKRNHTSEFSQVFMRTPKNDRALASHKLEMPMPL